MKKASLSVLFFLLSNLICKGESNVFKPLINSMISDQKKFNSKKLRLYLEKSSHLLLIRMVAPFTNPEHPILGTESKHNQYSKINSFIKPIQN